MLHLIAKLEPVAKCLIEDIPGGGSKFLGYIAPFCLGILATSFSQRSCALYNVFKGLIRGVAAGA